MICTTCHRPEATAADVAAIERERETTPDAEGSHLCWQSISGGRCEPSEPRLLVARLDPGAILPKRATPDAAGLDLHMLRPSRCPLLLQPGQRAKVRTGLQVVIPRGYEGQVRPRSGLSLRGVGVILGTVDADYRGEVHVILHNLGNSVVELDPDERIAQLVIAPVAMLEPVEVEPQPIDTERGTGGFGSTGQLLIVHDTSGIKPIRLGAFEDLGATTFDVRLPIPMDDRISRWEAPPSRPFVARRTGESLFWRTEDGLQVLVDRHGRDVRLDGTLVDHRRSAVTWQWIACTSYGYARCSLERGDFVSARHWQQMAAHQHRHALRHLRLALAVERAAERAERQAGKREALAQFEEGMVDNGVG